LNQNETDGSQWLVGGAEEIRNAGPLCSPDIQGRLVSQEIFNAAIPKKPHGGIFFGAIYRDGRAENKLISSCLSGGTTRLLGGWDRQFESRSLLQRGSANRKSDPSMTFDESTVIGGADECWVRGRW
jgi:hypothetical protein